MLARLVASHPLPLCQSVSKSYRKICPVNVVIHETGKVYGDGEGAAHLAATVTGNKPKRDENDDDEAYDL